MAEQILADIDAMEDCKDVASGIALAEKVFLALDKNGDGEVDKEEVKFILIQKFPNEAEKEAEAFNLMARVGAAEGCNLTLEHFQN